MKLIFLTLLFLPYLLGCTLVKSRGEPISDQTLSSISPGVTTKDEIIEKLGQPVAVAEPGQPITLLKRHGNYGGFFAEDLYINLHKIQGDTYFEPFSDKHVINESNRVYFFQYINHLTTLYYYVFYAYASVKTDSDNLWVLIDERNNLVVDYFFLTKGKRTRGINKKNIKTLNEMTDSL